MDESASQELCRLTDLANVQSEAFVVDYGLPQSIYHGQADRFKEAQRKQLPVT
ncbi:MAG: hypothetical protein J7K65_00975 [Planctomycetes bacterium]|nr:hypothetical protein [Planctomycetota bacterium]